MRQDKIVARIFLIFYVTNVTLAAPVREGHLDIADAASKKRMVPGNEVTDQSLTEPMPELGSDSDSSGHSSVSGSSHYSAQPSYFGSDYNFPNLDGLPPGTPSGISHQDSATDDNSDREVWEWEHADSAHEDPGEEESEEEDLDYNLLNEDSDSLHSSEWGWESENSEDEGSASGQGSATEASYHGSAPQSLSGLSHQNSLSHGGSASASPPWFSAPESWPESPGSSHYSSALQSPAGSHQDSAEPPSEPPDSWHQDLAPPGSSFKFPDKFFNDATKQKIMVVAGVSAVAIVSASVGLVYGVHKLIKGNGSKSSGAKTAGRDLAGTEGLPDYLQPQKKDVSRGLGNLRHEDLRLLSVLTRRVLESLD